MGMGWRGIYEFIWDEKWWFPNKVFGEQYGWEDMKNVSGSQRYLPQIEDLHWGVLLGAGLVVLRVLLERFVVEPLGFKLGIQRERKPYVTPSPVLEAAYKRRQRPNYEVLSKETDLTVRQIQVWFRRRKKCDATPKIKKFCDSGWHLVFYTTSFVYGLCVLWNKPWFIKTKECWIEWPKQHVSTDVYWYYMIELGFYCSLVFTLVSDHRRTDFKQMMVHHFATIVLIYFSWISNFVRAGTLVLILHDASDPWLEMAKLGIYLKRKIVTDVSFAIFVLVWTVSRHVLLPFVVLYTTTFEVLEFIDEPTFVNYFFNVFLYLLMLLTCIWSYNIAIIIYKTLTQGDVKDTRSDSEDEDSAEEQTVGTATNGKIENGNSNAFENENRCTLKSNSSTED